MFTSLAHPWPLWTQVPAIQAGCAERVHGLKWFVGEAGRSVAIVWDEADPESQSLQEYGTILAKSGNSRRVWSCLGTTGCAIALSETVAWCAMLPVYGPRFSQVCEALGRHEDVRVSYRQD